MKSAERSPLSITIIATDPPFTAGDGVLFGLQSGRDVDDPRPACTTTEFRTTVDIVRAAGSELDFAGEHVHGRRGDRFIYLAWGLPDSAEPFVMFSRAKIKLDSIPDDFLDTAIDIDTSRVLIAELRATNAKGQPASGTVKPPAIRWHTP